MITEADWRQWRADDLKPFVQAALDLFGSERCMFGSDWPVCELAGSYAQVHHALVEALGPIRLPPRNASPNLRRHGDACSDGLDIAD